MTEGQQFKLKNLIASGKTDLFYQWGEWLELRSEVMHLDNKECQMCKAKGKMRSAILVHHVKHVKDRPDLALSLWDHGERQLISLCRTCHEDCHPERTKQFRFAKRKRILTKERWD